MPKPNEVIDVNILLLRSKKLCKTGPHPIIFSIPTKGMMVNDIIESLGNEGHHYAPWTQMILGPQILAKDRVLFPQELRNLSCVITSGSPIVIGNSDLVSCFFGLSNQPKDRDEELGAFLQQMEFFGANKDDYIKLINTKPSMDIDKLRVRQLRWHGFPPLGGDTGLYTEKRLDELYATLQDMKKIIFDVFKEAGLDESESPYKKKGYFINNLHVFITTIVSKDIKLANLFFNQLTDKCRTQLYVIFPDEMKIMESNRGLVNIANSPCISTNPLLYIQLLSQFALEARRERLLLPLAGKDNYLYFALSQEIIDTERQFSSRDQLDSDGARARNEYDLLLTGMNASVETASQIADVMKAIEIKNLILLFSYFLPQKKVAKAYAKIVGNTVVTVGFFSPDSKKTDGNVQQDHSTKAPNWIL